MDLTGGSFGLISGGQPGWAREVWETRKFGKGRPDATRQREQVSQQIDDAGHLSGAVNDVEVGSRIDLIGSSIRERHVRASHGAVDDARAGSALPMPSVEQALQELREIFHTPAERGQVLHEAQDLVARHANTEFEQVATRGLSAYDPDLVVKAISSVVGYTGANQEIAAGHLSAGAGESRAAELQTAFLRRAGGRVAQVGALLLR